MSTAANPRANNPQQGGQETTGPVTSDSLAAESIKQGGGFSDNTNAHIESVKGSNSTFNTTDTSGATALHPAPDGATREKEEALGLGSDEKGTSGEKYEAANSSSFSGTHTSQGYTGGVSNKSGSYNTTTGGTHSGATGDSFADGGSGLTSSSSAKLEGVSSGSQALSSGSESTGQTTGQTASTSTSGSTSLPSGGSNTVDSSSSSNESQGGTAPNYAGVVSGAIQREGQNKPKGENLTEGDIPETKTFTGDVGGQHDPGRVAEQDMLKNAASSAGEQKYSGSGNDNSTGGAFDVLSSERVPDTSVPDKN